MTNKLFVLLAAVMLFAVLSGCGDSTAPVSSAPPPSSPVHSDPVDIDMPVEISVVTSYGGDDGNRQNYERALHAYESATGNTVRDSSGISNEEWKASVIDSFYSGSEPDVLFFFTGADSNFLVDDGLVISIDEIRALYPDYAANMQDDMLAKSPVDGKNYAVPVNGYWEGLFVNKTVLADCGVDIPDANTTWDQFLADCQIIADKGYTPIAASLSEVPHYWFEFCVFNNGNLENHAVLPESAGDNIGKNWAAGLSDIKDLYDRGFFPDNTTTAANAETDVLMIDNKAAFMIDGSWKLGWFAENSADINSFTVTFVPGKGQRKATDIIGGLSMGYFITKKAWDNPEKRDACVEFVMAMTTDEVVTTFGATAVTALKNAPELPANSNNLIKDALAMTRASTGFSPATADGLKPNSRASLFGNIVNIISGTMSPDEAINTALAISD